MTPRRPRRGLRALLAGALACGAVLGLSACGGEEWAQEVQSNPGDGLSGADGSWEVFPPDGRGEPIAFSGPTADGGAFDSAEHAGEVVVVNFWYAACPPCRTEAADLQAAWQAHRAEGVQFVGVNIYDRAPTVASFEESFGIDYPSILDVDAASVRLAFADSVSPQAIPTTLVLDRQGRVAGLIRGPVPPATLEAMIDEALAEPRP